MCRDCQELQYRYTELHIPNKTCNDDKGQRDFLTLFITDIFFVIMLCYRKFAVYGHQ